MKREIKFRAWDKFTNKMVFIGFHLFGEILTFSCLDQYCNENPNPAYESSLLRCNDIIITQYTGLLDKNGKEIYEGDIITNKFGSIGGVVTFGYYVNEKFTKSDQVRKHIGWYIDGKKAESLENECWYIDTHYSPKRTNNIEIIGNIYEHPELLTP